MTSRHNVLLFLLSHTQNIGWYIFSKHLTNPFENFTWKKSRTRRVHSKISICWRRISDKLRARSIVNSHLFIRIFSRLTWSIQPWLIDRCNVTVYNLFKNCYMFPPLSPSTVLFTLSAEKWMSRFSRWRVRWKGHPCRVSRIAWARYLRTHWQLSAISVTCVYRSWILLKESNLCKLLTHWRYRNINSLNNSSPNRQMRCMHVYSILTSDGVNIIDRSNHLILIYWTHVQHVTFLKISGPLKNNPSCPGEHLKG